MCARIRECNCKRGKSLTVKAKAVQPTRATAYRYRHSAQSQRTERGQSRKKHTPDIHIVASLGLARGPPLPCAPALARLGFSSHVCSVPFSVLEFGPDPTQRLSDPTPTLSALYFFSSRAGAGAGRGRWETTDAKSRLTTRPGPRPCVAGAACLLDAAVRRSVAGWCQVRSVVSDMCACVGRAKGGSHRM